MKKYKYFISITTLILLFIFKGCILDDFDTLTQNIPISKEFKVQGNTPANSTSDFCLSSSSIIQDYRNKIDNIQLVTATYQTISVTPTNTKGNIVITLADQIGNVLYQFTLNNVSPANYINTPLVLQFTDTDLQKINTYLASLKENTCFRASISVDTSPSGSSVTLNGKIDIAFKMKANI